MPVTGTTGCLPAQREKIMNIYSYNWWEVLFFILMLELAGGLMAYVLMNLQTGKYFKGGWRRRKVETRAVRHRPKL